MKKLKYLLSLLCLAAVMTSCQSLVDINMPQGYGDNSAYNSTNVNVSGTPTKLEILSSEANAENNKKWDLVVKTEKGADIIMNNAASNMSYKADKDTIKIQIDRPEFGNPELYYNVVATLEGKSPSLPKLFQLTNAPLEKEFSLDFTKVRKVAPASYKDERSVILSKYSELQFEGEDFLAESDFYDQAKNLIKVQKSRRESYSLYIPFIDKGIKDVVVNATGGGSDIRFGIIKDENDVPVGLVLSGGFSTFILPSNYVLNVSGNFKDGTSKQVTYNMTLVY